MPFTFEEAQGLQPAASGSGSRGFSFEEAQGLQPTTTVPKKKDKPSGGVNTLADVGGSVYNLARGAVMGPVSDVAGLAAIPLHAAGAIDTPPIDVKRKVEQAGAYEPRTAFGRGVEQYNPLALLARALQGIGGFAERKVAGQDPGPMRAALGYGVKGAIEQAPLFAGPAAKAGIEGAASAMRGGAERAMHSALKPTEKFARKGDVNEAIDTLLRKGINVTPGGLEKLRGQISAVDSKIGQLIAQSPATIDKAAVASRLDDALAKFAKQVTPQSDLAAIQRAFEQFMDHPLLPKVTPAKVTPARTIVSPIVDERGRPFTTEIPEQVTPASGTNEFPAHEAHELKRGTYQVLKDKYGQLGSADVEAEKALARGLKEEVAKAIPAVRPLTAEESRLMNALTPVERRVIISANKNPVGLGVLSMKPQNLAVWMADRSELFKSLIARMLNTGANTMREVAPAGPPLALGVYGAENNQIAAPPR